MDLERALSGGGMTSLSYWTYKCVLWPVGTFLAGVEGLGLVWSAIAAIPIFAIQYSLERKRQEKSGETAKKAPVILLRTTNHDVGREGEAPTEQLLTPVTPTLGTAAAMLILNVLAVLMLAFYYAGSAMAYFWA